MGRTQDGRERALQLGSAGDLWRTPPPDPPGGRLGPMGPHFCNEHDGGSRTIFVAQGCRFPRNEWCGFYFGGGLPRNSAQLHQSGGLIGCAD